MAKRGFLGVLGTWSQLARDGAVFVFQHIRSSKIRTILSLAGISIGIFTIVAIFVVIDSLKSNIEQNFQSLGDNTLLIEKWSMDAPWWENVNNPQPDFRDYQALRQHARHVGLLAMATNSTQTVRTGAGQSSRQSVMGITEGADRVLRMRIARGRGLSSVDYAMGSPMALIGAKLAEELFPNGDAIGQRLRIGHRDVQIVGLIKYESPNSLGGMYNEALVVAQRFFQQLVNHRWLYATILIRPATGISEDELVAEARRVLRANRGLRPSQPDNFALNPMSAALKELDSLFSILNLAGVLIGGLSVLVGGFGIANIMFVSVKERTRIIGIQKALGAKRAFILGQFLLESTILSILGGLVGLALLFPLTLGLSYLSEFPIHMTPWHVLVGILLSSVIGIISGFVPARNASRLHPVTAIDTTV